MESADEIQTVLESKVGETINPAAKLKEVESLQFGHVLETLKTFTDREKIALDTLNIQDLIHVFRQQAKITIDQLCAEMRNALDVAISNAAEEAAADDGPKFQRDDYSQVPPDGNSSS